MSHQDDTYFTPAEVDQQIERYLSNSGETPEEQTAARALRHLQRVYQIRQDLHAPSLERVWQRVLASEAEEFADTRQASHTQTEETGDERVDGQQPGILLP